MYKTFVLVITVVGLALVPAASSAQSRACYDPYLDAVRLTGGQCGTGQLTVPASPRVLAVNRHASKNLRFLFRHA